MSLLVAQRILVVGPGWLGAPLAARLAQDGASVWTLRRHVRDAPIGAVTSIEALSGDIRDVSPDAPWCRALPARLDHIVVCIAPNMQAGDAYADTYPVATAAALRLAAQHACRSLLYTGSTGVYGRTDGSLCEETDDITVQDARQDALRRAELHVMDTTCAPDTGRTILRVAGLYGPDRDPAGRFRTMVSDSDPWCNMAWRDDVIDAVRQRLADPPPAGRTTIFNCADGTPLRASAIARALGSRAPAVAASTRHAGAARSHQRISARALQATGWSPRMPTVLHGLAALGHVIQWEAWEEDAP